MLVKLSLLIYTVCFLTVLKFKKIHYEYGQKKKYVVSVMQTQHSVIWISVIIFTNITLKCSIVLQRHYEYMITHSKTCNAFYLNFSLKCNPHNSSQECLDI